MTGGRNPIRPLGDLPGMILRALPLAPTLVLALAGCGTPDPAVTAPPPTIAQAASLTPAEVAFVAQARRIAPRIVGSDERLAARGADTCTSLTDGRPPAQVVDQAVQRFSSGSYAVTRAEAEQLVAAARETVCRQ